MCSYDNCFSPNFSENIGLGLRINVNVRFGSRFYVLLNVQIFHGRNCHRRKCHGTDHLHFFVYYCFGGMNIFVHGLLCCCHWHASVGSGHDERCSVAEAYEHLCPLPIVVRWFIFEHGADIGYESGSIQFLCRMSHSLPVPSMKKISGDSRGMFLFKKYCLFVISYTPLYPYLIKSYVHTGHCSFETVS